MAIEWMDKYQVGDGKIDEEHREWFRLANHFLMAGDPQAKRDSGEVFLQYTRDHFFHEEVLMHEVSSPLRPPMPRTTVT